METGVSYSKQRLHKVGYFRELLSSNEEIHPNIRPLLKLSRDAIVRLQENGICPGEFAAAGPLAGRQNQNTQKRFRRGADHRPTWALEMRGGFALPLDQTSHQLLRALR